MANEYEKGQLWSYKTRTGEEQSNVLINKIEKDSRLGLIFHVSINNVVLKNPIANGNISTDLPHFPVSETTLNESVIELLGVFPVNPQYEEGYKIWKEAFDEGEAGIFTIELSEVVNFIEQTIASQ